MFSDSSKAAFSDPVSKPVQTLSIPSLKNTAQARGPERRVVLLPPSSFTLPSRAARTQMHPPVPEGLEVLASASTHPSSTPRTSLESEKQLGSSPLATSLSSRGSEDEEKAVGEGEVDEEEEIDEEQDDEECKASTREGAVRGVLLSQLKDQENLQERVAAMKNILKEFQDIKVTYR